jgi:rhamnosyltransferase
MRKSSSNTKSPVLYVLLAAFNGMEWIQEQVDSILRQQDINVFLFISVDFSTDSTYEWCQEMAGSDKRVVVLPYGGRFGSAAKNFYRLILDIEFSIPDYVALSDQDDIWLPNKIISAIKKMKISSSDGYSSNLLCFDAEKESEWLLKKDYPKTEFDYLFQGGSAGCTYVLSRQLINKIKAQIADNFESCDQAISHDWLIYAIARSYKYKWCLDSRAYIKYRQHANNVQGALSGFSGHVDRLSRIRNGWYRNSIMALQPFLSQSFDEIEIFKKIEKLSVWDKFWLTVNCLKFRRRKVEAIVMIIILLFGRAKH